MIKSPSPGLTKRSDRTFTCDKIACRAKLQKEIQADIKAGKSVIKISWSK